MTSNNDLQAIRDDLASILDRVDAMLAPPAADLVDHHRTTAIQQVLELESPLSPVQIAARLHSAGRDDAKHIVQVATQGLWARGQIARVSPGLYASLSYASSASRGR